MPRLLLKVMTLMTMETAGATVNRAAFLIVFLILGLAMPISLLRRSSWTERKPTVPEQRQFRIPGKEKTLWDG